MANTKKKMNDVPKSGLPSIIPEIFFSTGWLLAIFSCLCFIVPTLFFFVQVSLTSLIFIITFVITVILFVYFHDKTRKNLFLAIPPVLLFLIILGCSLFFSSQFYDLSFDGLYYHQTASIKMIEGWNPIYQQYPDNTTSRHMQLALSTYPKSFETIAALLSTGSGFIESGKSVNLILLLASIILGFEVVSCYIPSIPSPAKAALAIVLGCNPVLIAQIFSFYNDGMGGAVLTLLVLSILLYEKKKEYSYLVLIISLIITELSVKFTSGYYVVLILGSYCLYLFITHDDKFKRISLLSLICVVIGLGIFAFSPYVICSYQYGNPLYGLLGGELNFTESNPPIMLQLPPVINLIASIFSVSSNNGAQSFLQIKIPFTFSNDELLQFTMNDVRIGGFGPFTSGILILISIVFIFVSYRYRKELLHNTDSLLFLSLIAGIFISVIVNPVSWWARYAPQLWILLGLVVIFNLIHIREKSEDTKIPRYLTYITLIFMIFNVIVIVPSVVLMTDYNTQGMNQFLSAAERHEPVYVKSTTWDPFIYRLERNNISYQIVTDLPNNIAIYQLYDDNIMGIQL